MIIKCLNNIGKFVIQINLYNNCAQYKIILSYTMFFIQLSDRQVHLKWYYEYKTNRKKKLILTKKITSINIL